ncbi:glycosyltransferase family 2 protein [Paenibacillus sp. NPDC093718]|uniref:glycosyltransferase family 2 protein n=1 Tax=Paenibacillus sp. NPDC093718 TaxID=3390601 RepID=UPI003D0018AF
MKINNIANRLLGILGKKSSLKLVPLSDVERVRDQWRSTGVDPSFLLSGRYYYGWNIITWKSNCTEPIPIKIYWDNGEGFSEERTMKMIPISPGESFYKTQIFIPREAKQLRIDPGENELEFELKDIQIKKTTEIHMISNMVRHLLFQRGFSFNSVKSLVYKIFSTYKYHGFKGLKHKIRVVQNHMNESVNSYESWLIYNSIDKNYYREASSVIEQLNYKPLISVILPVYNVDEIWLRKCIDSVINQIYGDWELCISDDASTKPHIKRVLTEYMEKDERIRVHFRGVNGHISECSNSALDMANGEFIALLDHDDELAPNALYEVIRYLNEHPDADMIYSDEDKIGVNGERHSPYFKPDWSPDLILSHMYTCHLGVYRKQIISEIGGFRKGYEGSQDYDLVLRFTERTDKVIHIPKILYHWRSIPESTASGAIAKNYTHYAGLKALNDALKRRGIKGSVEELDGYSNMYRVHYKVQEDPLVSIIIPTKDMAGILDTCIDSIQRVTKYKNYEIIVVDNGSRNAHTFSVFNKWKAIFNERFKVIELDIPFNYSKLNNVAAHESNGEFLLLLNNDIEVISPDWLEEMVGYAQRKNTGAVGAKLFYPDKTIQHSGVVMGIGGIAGHAFRTCSEYDPGYFGMLLVNRNCSVVTAACLMVKKDLFFEVGGLEEELSVAFNDVDFCLKLLDKGYYNVILNNVSLYHHESKTRGMEDTLEKIERFSSEIKYMETKWSSVISNDPFYNPNLSLESDKSYNLKI